MNVRRNFNRRAYLTTSQMARHSPVNTELSGGASDCLNYIVLGVECINSDAFNFRELRSVSENGAPPQPIVLYYGAEVDKHWGRPLKYRCPK
ncbi:hypothetical protein EVAR_12029_1 [Eumeta japonica]|uniref:Uncharacterized protein n=1 Tax=Eumeta variegata TaxID=151549 RepID=A0A4C1U586_EUMVA|nr:hypothetical protein EVAR_12029_1 [Eumeta japonica]